MWILTPSITSAFAADTGASTSASSEQLAAAFAQSLLSRSKPSPQRTWLQRLKRDSWTTHLSGAISSDSLGESFTDWWTSSLAAIRASHSAQPASDSAPKTQDTSGRTYQPELLQCDQVAVSLKMSRDISRWGCPTLSKTWQDWVTERRGAYSARVKLARLTRGKESSSWRTPTEAETHNQDYSSQTYLQNQVQPNWPTANARDWKDSGPTQGNRQNPNLGTAVVKDAANWLTPQSGDVTGSTREAVVMWANGQRPKTSDQRLRTQVAAEELKHGQAAPASSSSLGSRQGLSWATPRANERDGTRTPNGNPKKDGIPLGMRAQQWATPQAHDAQGPKTPEQIAVMRAKGHGVKNLNEMVTWPTPSASCDQGGPSGLAGGSGNRKKLNSMLPEAEAKAMGCGKLNPRWVETLMGLPIGWVMPSCTSPQTIAPMSCDSSAMELCLPPQSEPSECLPLSWPTPLQMDHWMSNNPRTDGRQDQLPNAVAKYARQP
jgi:hypothetical protein